MTNSLVGTADETIDINATTAPVDGITVTGTQASSFVFNVPGTAKQTVAFINGIKPTLEGSKVDAQDPANYLGMAQFSLRYLEDDGTYTHRSYLNSVANTGLLRYSGIEAGTYKLVETRAPSGYALNAMYATEATAPIFTISKDNYASYRSGTPKTVKPLMIQNITDPPTRELYVTMVSTANAIKRVAGARYELSDDQGTVVALGTTSADGTVRLSKAGTSVPYQAEPGTYTLRQAGFTPGSAAALDFVDLRSQSIAPDDGVAITIDSDGYIESVTQIGTTKYANTGADEDVDQEGASDTVYSNEIRFSNVPKPSISVYKTGDTNIFEDPLSPSPERISQALSGAVFKFYRTDGEEAGLYPDGRGNAVEGSPASAAGLVTKDGGATGIGGLDPAGTYKVVEESVPGIDGTILGREKHDPFTNVTFGLGKNSSGEITGYTIKTVAGLTAYSSYSGNRISVDNPVEKTYRVKLNYYTIAQQSLFGPKVFMDAIGGEFYLQKKTGDTWVTVDHMTTGTGDGGDIDYEEGSNQFTDKEGLNTAVSRELPAGEYRLVQTSASYHSWFLDFYQLNDGANPTASPASWSNVNSQVSDYTITDYEGAASIEGKLLPGTFTIGAGGMQADINDVYLANDDKRSTGQPYSIGYHIRLHGVKEAIERYYDQGGSLQERKIGDIAAVRFEAAFGYLDDKGDFKTIKDLGIVESGTVEDEPGGFITAYTDFDNLTTAQKAFPAGATPCFMLNELGPVPESLVQPQVGGTPIYIPFELPTNSSQGYFDIEAEDGSRVIVVKNYTPDAVLAISKYSLLEKDKPAEERTALESTFEIYEAKIVDGVDTPTTKVAVVELTDLTSGNVNLLSGRYFIKETGVPDGYNPTGVYRYDNGADQTFDRMMGPITIGTGERTLEVFDSPYGEVKIDMLWAGSTNDQNRAANYSLTYSSGDYQNEFIAAGHTQGELVTVGSGTATVEDLPDGVYLLRETGVVDPADAHNRNRLASSDTAIRIAMVRGTVASVQIVPTGGEDYRSVNGYMGGAETYDNIRYTASTNLIAINHLPKSKLRIVMGHIDEVGLVKDGRNTITEATFEIKKSGSLEAGKTVVWNAANATRYSEAIWYLDVPLEDGVYEVVQKTVTDGTEYAIDSVMAYAKISETNEVTYLRNNTAAAYGLASTAALPLQPTVSTATLTNLKFFYNRMNAGKLVITKLDTTDDTVTIDDAGFTITAGENTQTVTSGTQGAYTFAKVWAAQGGTDYGVVESTTPAGYYADSSSVPKKILPNQVNTLTIKNVPLTTVTVHKEAQLPDYIDENGVHKTGAINPVWGLDLKLYKNGSATPCATGTTDDGGNFTFTGLEPGDYRIEEQDNLPSLDVGGNTQFNTTNSATHFTVTYTAHTDCDQRSVAVTKVGDIDYDTATRTVSVFNQSKDSTILLSAKKIDATDEDTVLENAYFELCDAQGNALVTANKERIPAKTNASGVAYFHFLDTEVFSLEEGGELSQDPYEGDYWIRETKAPDGYVISPYEEDHLKMATFEEGSNRSATVVFKDRKSETAPSLTLAKSTIDAPSVPLAQQGFSASYVLEPSNPAGNALPLSSYTVKDTGFTFLDAEGQAIADARLTYRITGISIAKTEALGADGSTVYASIDNGQTYKPLDGATQAFTPIDAAASAADSEGLFEVLYAHQKADGSFERVVGTDFRPGAITVTVAFDRFAMDAGSVLSNDVKTIENTAVTTAAWPVQEGTMQPLTSNEAKATVTFPPLPEMQISLTPLFGTTEFKRGSSVQYEIALTNDSGQPVKNPVLLSRATPVVANGQSSSPLTVRLDSDGEPVVDSLISPLTDYDSYAWGGGETVAWVFKGELAAGASIRLTYTADIGSVILADSVENVAYGTSIVDPSDLTKVPAFYSAENPRGAQYKAKDADQVIDAVQQAELVAAAGSTIDGALTIHAAQTSQLEVISSLSPAKSVSTDGVNWYNQVSVEPGGEYYYRLQAQYDDREGGGSYKKVRLLDILPFEDYLETGWDNALTDKLTVSGLTVEGFDASGTYRKLDEVTDYTVIYSTEQTYADLGAATASDATINDCASLAIAMDEDFELKPKQYITVTYKVTVPAVGDLGISNDVFEKSARTYANANYNLRFMFGLSEVSMTSKQVAVRLMGAPVSLSGIVWDDINRDGVKGTDEAVREGEVVHLYRSDDGGTLFSRHGSPVSTGADGSYAFTDLESSVGAGGPVYKVEVVNPDADVYDFSLKPAQVNTASVTSGIEAIASDRTTGASAVLVLKEHGTLHAGINTVPYSVTYLRGAAATQVSGLPSADTNEIAKQNYAIKGSGTASDPKPSATGYSFAGWKVTADSSNALDKNEVRSGGSTFTMPANDVVLTAQWTELAAVPIEYKAVTQKAGELVPVLSTDGGTVDRAQESIAPVTGAPQGSTPTNKAGYQFDGWYKDAACLDPVSAGWIPSGTTLVPGRGQQGIFEAATYYAKFIESPNVTLKYEVVTFRADGQPALGVYGGTLSVTYESLPPATGTAMGSKATANTYYRFDGWFADASCTAEVADEWKGADGAMAPGKAAQETWIDNTTYYAKFIEDTIDDENQVPVAYEVVTFDAEGSIIGSVGGDLTSSGEKLAVLSGVPAGSTATARAGYTYAGWYGDDECLYDVPTAWVGERSVTPVKSGSEWAPATYYAKMVVDVTDIEVAGYTGVYDGQSHGVTVLGHLPTDELRYFVNGDQVDNLFVDCTAGTDVAVEIWRDGVLVWSEATQGTRAHAEVAITPRPLEVVTGSASRAYNGDPLTNEEITVSGLVAGEVLDAQTTGTITEVGSVPNTYDPRWGIEPAAFEAGVSMADVAPANRAVEFRSATLAKKMNYEIVKEELGTLTITEAAPEAMPLNTLSRTGDPLAFGFIGIAAVAAVAAGVVLRIRNRPAASTGGKHERR